LKISRKDLLIVAALVVASMAIRAVYILSMGVPRFDPWRHLALIENIRAGRGFTLFDGQPYIWYHPLWYRLCAAFPRSIGPAWIAGFLSAVSVGLVYLWLMLRGGKKPQGRMEAAIAAVMAAAFGPMIAFTCHYGPESMAIGAVLAALVLAEARRSVPAAGVSGVLAGLAGVMRLNLIWAVIVGLVAVRGRRRKMIFLGGAAVPIALAWLRNHAAVGSHPFLFTWDGIATRTADFNVFSTLAIQAHPTVKAALTALHRLTVPSPDWLLTSDGVQWGSALFMLAGAVALVLSRKRILGVVGALSLIYMALLDPTRTGNFFRIYAGLFPLMFAALAELAGRLAVLGGARRRWAPGAVAAAVIFCGLTYLIPAGMVPLEGVTPPPGLLQADGYMVNSGFYHPESLCYAYPGRRFIGLPLRPEEFDAFRKSFPGYRFIMWHDFSVQDDLAKFLIETQRVVPRGSAVNALGRKYDVWELK
jgi:hypothetical protein